MEKVIISGSIKIPKEIRNKKIDTYIRVLDTSFEDSPAVIIAESNLQSVSLKQFKGDTFPFEVLMDTKIEPSHDYTISVLLDLDGDGAVSKNDYIQQQSYNAIRQGKLQQKILIELQKV